MSEALTATPLLQPTRPAMPLRARQMRPFLQVWPTLRPPSVERVWMGRPWRIVEQAEVCFTRVGSVAEADMDRSFSVERIHVVKLTFAASNTSGG